MVLAEKLKLIRLTLCFSGREFAREMGISSTSVHEYEAGNTVPSRTARLAYLEQAQKAKIKLLPVEFDILKKGRAAPKQRGVKKINLIKRGNLNGEVL